MHRQGKKSYNLVIMVFVCALVVFVQTRANALMVINEILADPAASSSGDSNNDGITSSTNDEFVELLNYDVNSVNISGWSLADAISIRHVFPSDTILNPYQYLVVFGGGNPNLPNVTWQKASTGTLSLNNTSETVKLLDNQSNLIDQVIYGSLANQDQSIVRHPEGIGTQFVLHTSLVEGNGAPFSPGKSVNGEPLVAPLAQNQTTVPECSTLAYLLMGGMGMLKRRFKG